MAVRVLNFAGYVCLLALIMQVSGSEALINSTPDVNRIYPKAISDLKETILKSSGLQSEDVKLSGFDLKGALVGRSMEFDLQIDNKILPIKLLDDVNNWEYVDLPTLVTEDQPISSDENGLVEKKHDARKGLPTLPPFQLAGPMELWIQDAKDMRLFLPHDVDAGELKKVMLADGAVVTVKGAKSVTLRHPIELPLPLNKTKNDNASGLLALGNHLRHASRTQRQLVSLRIVGPTSLNSPATSSPASNKLKLKRLAPGLVELSSVPNPISKTAISAIDLHGDVPTVIPPDHLTSFWPVASINGSNSNLRGLETLLSAVLDSMGSNGGSFKVLRAEVSARTFLKMGFQVEKKVAGNESFWEGYPEWRTKPERLVTRYEVLGKVDGEKIVPEKVVEVDRVTVEDTVAPGVIIGNLTMSKIPIFNAPLSPFAL